MNAFAKKTKISIIIPVYNVEKYLKQCLKSVVEQTLKDIEIIVINDGSTDDCAQIIDEFKIQDERIKVINQKNLGYSVSLNYSIDISKGEYIAIVEADDFVDLKMYENLYDIAKNNNSDIVKSSFYKYFEQENKIQKELQNINIESNESFTLSEKSEFLRYHPSIWSCIYKKDFLNEKNIRFKNLKGACWQDNLFQLQTMYFAKKINFTKNAYYYWRISNSDESESLKNCEIPLLRTKEIHNWLNENNVKDEKILLNLSQRELIYAKIILRKKKLDKNYCEIIKELISNIPYKAFMQDKTIKKSDKRTLFLLKLSPKLTRFLLLLQKNINLFLCFLEFRKKQDKIQAI